MIFGSYTIKMPWIVELRGLTNLAKVLVGIRIPGNSTVIGNRNSFSLTAFMYISYISPWLQTNLYPLRLVYRNTI